MEKQCKKTITWTIKKLPLLRSEEIHSDQFVLGGCKWFLGAVRDLDDRLFMFLEVADHESLPSGWSIHARYVVIMTYQKLRLPISIGWKMLNVTPSVLPSGQNGTQRWFDEKCPHCVINFPLHKFAEDSGFLVKGEIKIVAEVEVLEVIGKLDVSEKTSTIMETVGGFQLHSSQVEFASHMFERHPEIASEFRPKNPTLRTGYMSLLISLIETLRHSPHKLHQSDIAEAYAALRPLTDAGFKLDWLEKKLDEISTKKEKEEAGETRVQEIEEELKDLKHKCSDLEAQLEKEKAEVSDAKSPVSFDDVI
ncbi:unnamed protein product [Microthlaspi erraticum]|uniref:MATH domain-containing protein n=1 Tax=Microthlaspi erraticum TaxID=1685480 RepID=A0A6D2K3M4_9BRAS|nr:unnamed protein product [Microthlaspi erraticum]